MTEPELARLRELSAKLHETFDPGGNLPEDCTEWAAAHLVVMDELDAWIAAHQEPTPLGENEVRCPCGQGVLKTRRATPRILKGDLESSVRQEETGGKESHGG